MSSKVNNQKWLNCPNHFKDMLQKMINSDDHTDVTLVCDDQEQFKAHKMILSASSPLFKSLLNSHSQNEAIIYLAGVKSQEMMSILEFIYLGKTKFDKGNFENDVKSAAKNLEIIEMINPYNSIEYIKQMNQAKRALIKLNEHIKSEPKKQENEKILNSLKRFPCMLLSQLILATWTWVRAG